MEEAGEVFESEWDPFPEPKLSGFQVDESPTNPSPIDLVHVNLDADSIQADGGYSIPEPRRLAQAMTLWFAGADWKGKRKAVVTTVSKVLQANPHSTLQVVLEPTAAPEMVTPELTNHLLATCFAEPNYLDRYYSLHPGGLLGSKTHLDASDL